MKKQLSKKLGACLSFGMAFIVTAMLFSASANAQIIYTDIIPDTTFNVSIYNLDLNNDGIDDFKFGGGINACPPIFSPLQGVKSSVYISVLNGNTVASSTYPLAMNLNDIISSGLTWFTGSLRTVNTGVCTNYGGSTYGNWTGLTDNYLGLKLIVGPDTYYGWLRMQVYVSQTQAKGIIKEYAYNTMPNQPILAGQTTTTGIAENSFASSINLFPNPAENHLTIALGSNTKKVEITIADITGKVI